MRPGPVALATPGVWIHAGRALLAGVLSGCCAFVVGGEWKALVFGAPIGCWLELRARGRTSARPLAHEVVAGALVGSLVLALRHWRI